MFISLNKIIVMYSKIHFKYISKNLARILNIKITIILNRRRKSYFCKNKIYSKLTQQFEP